MSYCRTIIRPSNRKKLNDLDFSPNVISEMGGVLAIWGKDFAADNFNQFDPMLGNKVCLIISIRLWNFKAGGS